MLDFAQYRMHLFFVGPYVISLICYTKDWNNCGLGSNFGAGQWASCRIWPPRIAEVKKTRAFQSNAGWGAKARGPWNCCKTKWIVNPLNTGCVYFIILTCESGNSKAVAVLSWSWLIWKYHRVELLGGKCPTLHSACKTMISFSCKVDGTES